MDSENTADSQPPRSWWWKIFIASAVICILIVVSGYAVWANRANVAEAIITDFLEGKGFEVKAVTVSKAETTGMTIKGLHLFREGDIKIADLSAAYTLDGIRKGRIDSFKITNLKISPKGALPQITVGTAIGTATLGLDDILDGSALTIAFREILAEQQKVSSITFKAKTKNGFAAGDLLIQVDLSRLQIVTKAHLAAKRWPTEISVDGLFYFSEITKLIGNDHPISGWLTVSGDAKLKGIRAFFDGPNTRETLELEGKIKLRARQLANVFGFSEGMAGSDRLNLNIINLRATPKFARARFNLYAYATGRVSNFFTYQNTKLNLQGVATNDANEAKVQLEKGNLAIDLPVYLGDVFLRDQIEVGLHKFKNYVRYSHKDASIDYRLHLNPLPIFVSIPTHRATVRANIDFEQMLAEGRSNDRHDLKVAIKSVAIPTYALRANTITFDASTKNAETELSLNIAKFAQTDKTPLMVPLALAATAKTKNGVLKGQFNANAPLTGLKVIANFNNDFNNFKGEIGYKLPPVRFGPGGDNITKISPLLASQLKAVRGAISAKGGYRWGSGTVPDGHIQVQLYDLSAQSDTARLANLSGAIKFKSLNPPATTKLQQLTANLSVGDLKAVPMEINWRLNADGSLGLDPFVAKFAGGKLSTTTVLLNPETKLATIPLTVDKVDVTEIFRLIGVAGLSGTGKLSGIIPIQIDGEKVSIKSGALNAVEPGLIRLNGGALTKSLETKGHTVAMALKTLSDFHYKTMSIGLEKSEAGEGHLTLRMEGKNPKVYNGHPFVFNIRLESNFDNLAKFALQGIDTADNILKWAGGKHGLGIHMPGSERIFPGAEKKLP
jgi:hypothetical protein